MRAKLCRLLACENDRRTTRGALAILPAHAFKLEMIRINEGVSGSMHVLILGCIEAWRRCQIESERVCRALCKSHPGLISQHAEVRHRELAVHIVIDAQHLHRRILTEVLLDHRATRDETELSLHLPHLGGCGRPLADQQLHALEGGRALVSRHLTRGCRFGLGRLTCGDDDDTEKEDLFEHGCGRLDFGVKKFSERGSILVRILTLKRLLHSIDERMIPPKTRKIKFLEKPL